MSSPWLIVGLGNPGTTYQHTRHNAGFNVVDELARRAESAWTLQKVAKALVTRARIGVGPGGVPGPGAILLKPQSFMNRSGGAVGHTASYFGIEPDRILVVHDDLDLAAGTIKLRRGGGEGGHNGLKDVSAALGTTAYLRVKLGIGRPPGGQDPIDFVLAPIPVAQREEWGVLTQRGADAVEDIVLRGLDAAQLHWHTQA